jgi:hypothetical protein
LVERNLAKVEVAGSNPVSRSKSPNQGSVAEWSCSGLQIRQRRFDSDPSLHFLIKINDLGLLILFILQTILLLGNGIRGPSAGWKGTLHEDANHETHHLMGRG